MKDRISKLLTRLDEVEKLLGDPALPSDKKRYREVTQEHSYLSEIREAYHVFEEEERAIVENERLLKEESDQEILEMVREELAQLKENAVISKAKVEALLVPPDPRDNLNVVMELRAGTGGDEAAIFVGDCVRMYRLYADQVGLKYELLSGTPSDAGGFKEIILIFSGKNAFRFLKYEGGTHRVQRVPETETQGRVHTSAITVAILTEPLEEDEIEIKPDDLKIDTYRASGAGGQHVNTTDSAVRITHLPTNTVVTCQEERSQHKNRDKAMRLLKAKISETKRLEEEKKRAEERSEQVGTGDRSEKIRTYNYPQNRVTDHRIGLTLYKLDQVMQGDLEELVQGMLKADYEKKMQGDTG
ncbi:MAG: peptide chain release factor 1 [Candidatus Algichlamydia australiensis]|nr:peptide chain release factor 1 [Chlamydiales bacterium]